MLLVHEPFVTGWQQDKELIPTQEKIRNKRKMFQKWRLKHKEHRQINTRDKSLGEGGKEEVL